MSLHTRPNTSDRASLAFHVLTLAVVGLFSAAALLHVAVQFA